MTVYKYNCFDSRQCVARDNQPVPPSATVKARTPSVENIATGGIILAYVLWANQLMNDDDDDIYIISAIASLWTATSQWLLPQLLAEYTYMYVATSWMCDDIDCITGTKWLRHIIQTSTRRIRK